MAKFLIAKKKSKTSDPFSCFFSCGTKIYIFLCFLNFALSSIYFNLNRTADRFIFMYRLQYQQPPLNCYQWQSYILIFWVRAPGLIFFIFMQIFTVRNSNCGKVMFSQEFCSQWGGGVYLRTQWAGGVCPSGSLPGGCTNPETETDSPPTQSQTPPPDPEVDTPKTQMQTNLPPQPMTIEVGGTHSTGMHSCLKLSRKIGWRPSSRDILDPPLVTHITHVFPCHDHQAESAWT